MINKQEKQDITSPKLIVNGSKSFTDARELALCLPSKRLDNDRFCKICRDGGSLLMCSHCLRSFHLKCISMREEDVPAFYWNCSHCQGYEEKTFRTDAQKLEKQQRQWKELQMRDALARINNSQKDSALKLFHTANPSFVKQGKIVYPIEDSLLPKNLQLHKLQSIPDLPTPTPLRLPSDIAGNIFYICDFVSAFTQILQVTPFTVLQLYSSLREKHVHSIVKETFMALVGLLCQFVWTKDSMEDSLECRYIVTLAALLEVLDVKKHLHFTWNLLLAELLKVSHFREYSDDPVLEQVLVDVGENAVQYEDLNVAERVALLTFLVHCAYDTKEIHDQLSMRIENKTDLVREKMALSSKLKELHQEKTKDKLPPSKRKAISLQDKIAKTQASISEIQQKLEDIGIRNASIGQDRDFNEYYAFLFDSNRLYVRLAASDSWGVFTKVAELETLQSSLCQKGIRENKLFDGLRKSRRRLKLDSEHSDDIDTYANTLSQYKKNSLSLDVVKEVLLGIEKKFADFLKKIERIWCLQTKQTEWKSKVKKATAIDDLAKLLLKHSKKASAPLRLAAEDSSSDSEGNQPQKYRKVTIRIWQDMDNTQLLWQELLQEASCLEHIAMCIGIYKAVLENYMHKKILKQKQEEEKSKKKTRKEEEPRRSTRNERRKKKVEEPEHDDDCYFCDDGGELICCESCPTVVHPKCIGLRDIPDDDWYCDNCKKETEGRRMTRSKTFSRRLIK